jgi:hypothetical protein
MVFLEERLGDHDEEELIEGPYILERGKNKRLAGSVIRPPTRSRCFVRRLPKRCKLMAAAISETIVATMRN